MSKEMTLVEQDIPVHSRDKILAWCIIIATWIGIRLVKIEYIYSLLRKLKKRCKQDMTLREAKVIASCVYSARKIFWGRVACLETSLSIFLLALLKQRSVQWYLGVKLGPFSSHAWIEVEGKPLDNEANEYQKVMKI
ncbi:hypothetical protein C1X05_00470 [Laceyella sacchari]|uniref:Transglutaminase-like superfamily protein n=1 Tax=Laceyella tengchongensis TaxID=574699 RepID=A0AA46AGU4_9BACL|nr:lasso peptide biosynthesis B2 protein [Laceyella tengchongensis]AUS07480.1 hypothetical protein C1X05_00470 [Laceyella sacchari]SMP32722.1 Transglutaminase-like superfamily protein [Laceyella tengchongensis]